MGGAVVEATAEAEAVAIADLDPDPCLGLLEADVATRGDQGVLATAGAPGDLFPHLQRSAAPHLMEAGVQGAPALGTG
jgi:hypothetical protein